jgi:hypothetical protein
MRPSPCSRYPGHRRARIVSSLNADRAPGAPMRVRTYPAMRPDRCRELTTRRTVISRHDGCGESPSSRYRRMACGPASGRLLTADAQATMSREPVTGTRQREITITPRDRRIPPDIVWRSAVPIDVGLLMPGSLVRSPRSDRGPDRRYATDAGLVPFSALSGRFSSASWLARGVC